MAEERILTLHPEGKNGVNIPVKKYEQMKAAILKSLPKGKTISLKDLQLDVIRQLEGQFQGSIVWHLISVKHDLEAKGIIERVEKMKPQHLRRLN